ncbi:Asp23/Gls24 family envelope stress response protein [Lentzea sp. NPDC004782]|uniref:Asp23/Gls24 family envelope stress response protein n=1 Tax=Lentzea sp. NPDC004782 TaxID=3154458 RepID=UPI0033AEC0E4
MSEIISTFFSRPRNDIPGTAEEVTTPASLRVTDAPAEVVTEETVDTEAIPAEDETAEAVEELAPEATDEDAADEDTAEEADEDAVAETEEDAAAEDESAGEDEPTALETEDAATEDAATEIEDAPVVGEVDVEAEPVAGEAPQARPAASSRGSVTLSDSVVAKVVTVVVGKVDGVHGLDDEGVSVAVEDDVATVKVSLVIEYGHAIKALAEQIRVDVIEAVEQFLGYDVAAVDVHVSDIHVPDAL